MRARYPPGAFDDGSACALAGWTESPIICGCELLRQLLAPSKERCLPQDGRTACESGASIREADGADCDLASVVMRFDKVVDLNKWVLREIPSSACT